jgi:hypothetical protein
MGPALIGLLTTALSLQGALCSLVVAMAVILLLARQVRVADEVREATGDSAAALPSAR